MRPLGGIGRFLTSMDSKAATSLGVSAVLMLAVLALFFFGQRWIHIDDEGRLAAWLAEFARSPFAVPIIVGVFFVLALTGFPQWFLIAGTILAFGAREGAFYSWVATMISATFTFALGRWMGGAFVERFGGPRTRATIDFIGRHGVLASAVIRVVPSAPFIVVNAAAGAARIPLWKYWAGTSVGIVPKILIVALLSQLGPDQQSFSGGVSGLRQFIATLTAGDYLLLLSITGGWLGFLFVVRRIYFAMRRPDRGL